MNTITSRKKQMHELPIITPGEQLVRAAHALVEAASWGHYAQYGRFLCEDTKAQLVEAVVENPILVEQLFTRDGVNLH